MAQRREGAVELGHVIEGGDERRCIWIGRGPGLGGWLHAVAKYIAVCEPTLKAVIQSLA
jgi:hypothetical protein